MKTSEGSVREGESGGKDPEEDRSERKVNTKQERKQESCNAMQRKENREKRLSKKERRVDALALRAEERRDKLRKAVGRSTYPAIHGSLNGGTHTDRLRVSVPESIGCGGEPGELKHLSSRRKRKQK